ncbi:MAG: class I SAM-dependent methyltransferase [Acidobacteria bacterium]|nr:class I SAM-dependent methyltransferase [Acidobacteriota bacterium]
MLPYLREAVGARGRIFAEDIFPDFLEKAKARAQEKNLDNVTFIHGGVKDAQLPAASVDVALVLDVYHHFDYPAEMLASLAKGLKDGGRLMIVDFYKQGFRDPKHIRLDEKEMIAEVESHGFCLIKSGPFTPDRQYLAPFEKKQEQQRCNASSSGGSRWRCCWRPPISPFRRSSRRRQTRMPSTSMVPVKATSPNVCPSIIRPKPAPGRSRLRWIPTVSNTPPCGAPTRLPGRSRAYWRSSPAIVTAIAWATKGCSPAIATRTRPVE